MTLFLLSQVTGLTYQTGQDEVVRAQFINSGKLLNTKDTQFRAVSDDWPVFALSHDLGTISAATPPVVVSIGHIRDPAVQYIIANGALQNRSLYFWSQFSSVQDAVSKSGHNSFIIYSHLNCRSRLFLAIIPMRYLAPRLSIPRCKQTHLLFLQTTPRSSRSPLGKPLVLQKLPCRRPPAVVSIHPTL